MRLLLPEQPTRPLQAQSGSKWPRPTAEKALNLPFLSETPGTYLVLIWAARARPRVEEQRGHRPVEDQSGGPITSASVTFRI